MRGRRLLQCLLALLAPCTVAAATAWACSPSATIAVSPTAGPAGAQLRVSGKQFTPDTVQITGPPGLAATTTGPAFDVGVTIPDVPPGFYFVTASTPAGRASAVFEVTAPPPPPPPPPPVSEPAPPPSAGEPAVDPAAVLPSPDLVSAPALLAPAIRRPTAAERTASVSPAGGVTIVCGHAGDNELRGTCGATSPRPALNLRPRPFSAPPGAAIRVRFHVARALVERIAAAGHARMRGTVTARSPLGAQTTKTFTFTLKAAPRAHA